MAARHMQRMRALQELESNMPSLQQEEDASGSEESEDDGSEGGGAIAAPFNPFDLLDEDEGEEASSVASEELESGCEEASREQPPAHEAQEPSQTKSKKKRKKKKGAKGGEGAPSGSGRHGKDAVPADDGEDIDAILKGLNIPASACSPGLADGGGASGGRSLLGPLLAVDTKKLRAEDELRRIFGSKVIDAEMAAEQQQLGAQRRRGVQPRGSNRRRAASKKGLLIAPKEHWPRVDGGLSMEKAGLRDGQPLFRYTYSAAYAAQQEVFRDLQATYNPNNIAGLLQSHPFHVDALLAMNDLYRYSGEVGYSEEMLERCLYALETAWHPAFNPASAACQLDYADEKNRPMFTALFRHMMNKSRQSCHSTALECCKLLLAFDKDDPCGALQTIDYMALRAEQYEFLLRFVDEWDGGKTSMQLLPNFAFSTALASFCLRDSAQMSDSEQTSSPDSVPPEEKLIQACLLYPIVVVRVLAKLREKGVGQDAWWGSILERRHFASASDGGSASLSHVVDIFAERQHLLWKPTETLLFLRTAAEAAADIADGKREPIDASADDWACVRSEAFPPCEKNAYRHLQVADFSDTINRIPPEELQAGMGGGMVAAPEDLQRQLEEELAQLQERYRLAGGPHLTDEEMQNANPLMMLLQSMLPWVDAGEDPGLNDAADRVPPEDQPGPDETRDD